MLLVVQQLSTKLCCGMKHGDQMSVMLCCLLQHKNNEVSRRSAQGPVKKADKSKPMHQSFRLFSEQPTIDKKKRLVQRQGAVSLGAELCRCDMEPGADMSMCMGHGCHQLMWGVLFHGVQHRIHRRRRTKARHCIRISGCSAGNQRPTKRLVTAWYCVSQCYAGVSQENKHG